MSQTYCYHIETEEAFFNRWPSRITTKLAKPLTGKPGHLRQLFFPFVVAVILIFVKVKPVLELNFWLWYSTGSVVLDDLLVPGAKLLVRCPAVDE